MAGQHAKCFLCCPQWQALWLSCPYIYSEESKSSRLLFLIISLHVLTPYQLLRRYIQERESHKIQWCDIFKHHAVHTMPWRMQHFFESSLCSQRCLSRKFSPEAVYNSLMYNREKASNVRLDILIAKQPQQKTYRCLGYTSHTFTQNIHS